MVLYRSTQRGRTSKAMVDEFRINWDAEYIMGLEDVERCTVVTAGQVTRFREVYRMA